MTHGTQSSLSPFPRSGFAEARTLVPWHSLQVHLREQFEMSGLALRLAHKKGRDIFFKFGYAAGDEAYALH